MQAKAQYANTHYIAPSPWQYFNRYNELVITTLSTTAVPVTISSSDGTVYSNSLTTVAGTPLRYRFTATDAASNAPVTILNGQGIIVSGTSAISVQVRNIASDNYTSGGQGPGDISSCIQKGNSAFTSLGDQGVGTSFRVGYYANVTGSACFTGETGAAVYSVLAISNSTSVSVNGTLLVTLNAGQSYLFQATLGSLVTANNNIVVNAGMRCDNTSGCGDGVESQVMPISYLGTTYVVVRSNGSTGYERSTIVATQAGTTVAVLVPSTGVTTNYTLTNAGDFVTINNGDGATAYTTSYITTNKAVAVYTGSADGCEIDMIVQPPLSSCAGSYDVQTNQFLNNANGGNSVFPYFGYIILQSSSAIVYINGTNIETLTSARTQIGTTGYYFIKFTNTQLSNPANLRFTSTARMNIAFIESGAGYSMSSYISSTTSTMPPPSFTSSCNPSTFTAQAGFSSYQWYNNGVAISGATSQTYSAASNGNYTVTGTAASCGTTPQSPTITINAKPNAGNDQTICAGNSATLSGSPTSGTSWIAQSGNPTGATLGNTTNGVATASFTTSSSGTFNFVLSAGCTDTMSVFVNALPTVAAITGTTTTFVGGTTTLSNTTTNGVYTSSNTAIATVASTTGVVTGVAPGTVTITYTVTNANGCSSSVTATITINAKANG